MYKSLIRPLLFRCDPERIHDVVLQAGGMYGKSPFLRKMLRQFFGSPDDPRLAVKLGDLEFPNPVGLAAGFDKDAKAIEFFSALGFGHIEAGTITPRAQPGNPKPRIFRYPADLALINRMGFPSAGAPLVSVRLKALKRLGLPARVGVNFGKSKDTPIDQAVSDYLLAFEQLKGLGDFFVLNVSSPNTPELRKLQEQTRLSELLAALNAVNLDRTPLLVKIAPDLSLAQLDQVVETCLEHSVAGLIATNTTISRGGLSSQSSEAGGMSGRPLAPRSLEILRHLWNVTKGKLPLVSSGGVFTAEDAIERMRAGACMVQLYTGFIYEGPAAVRAINRGLLAFAEANGLKSLQQIVGQS